ncbi:hypothetical protein CDO73_11095 [Saccharibacillus sp. O23]|uniref:hypothetical protein n=1 Tax=Saccharibacillus sp. O23 TaxID=2009338 RepID=UPI000B4E3046|nr:hypothetical protein [Saccharibacillus sp. O23]OWR30454.1 hypothetical protein CDO73_11095 [Saccharibacillus sp. O23]
MKQNEQTIYIDTTSVNLWFGFYGLDEPSSNEHVWIYATPDVEDPGNLLAWIGVGSKNRLREILEAEGVPTILGDETAAAEEEPFLQEIRRLLASDKTEFRYFYDDPLSGKLRELPYPDLPRDERGALPCFIEVYPPAEYLERETFESGISAFCEKFLNIRAQKIVHLRPMRIETATEEYVGFAAELLSLPPIDDEQIADIARRTSRSENEIRRLLAEAERSKSNKSNERD